MAGGAGEERRGRADGDAVAVVLYCCGEGSGVVGGGGGVVRPPLPSPSLFSLNRSKFMGQW